MEGILAKAGRGEGLAPAEIESLLHTAGPSTWADLSVIASDLTTRTFGRRMHFFAPLYFSSHCVNDCAYCGFRRSAGGARSHLDEAALLAEAEALWLQGYRSVLLVAGEHPHYAGAPQIAAIVRLLKAEGYCFRLLVETAPLSVEGYREIAEAGVDRVLCFQETYDRKLYDSIHSGPKRDFNWRLESLGRALSAGIPSVGLGLLLGISPDPWNDFLALADHAWQIRRRFGVFPATFSFPRFRRAEAVDFQAHPVSDLDFHRMLVLARVAFPETGLVLTTREAPEFRDLLVARGTGITHLSAGVSVRTGGYARPAEERSCGQFEISDTRPLRAVMDRARQLGYAALPF